MGRKKKLPLLKDLEILDFAAQGKSLGKVDNQVVFVPGLVPGDIADVQVKRKRKNYMEGFLVALKKPSSLRIDPVCNHFGVCGGCKWQHLHYDKQLEFKQRQVEENLKRIGKTELPPINTIIGSEQELYYRNKLEFTFSDTRWLTGQEIDSGENIQDRRALGFHIPGKFDRILNITNCYLQDELSNRIRNEVRRFTLDNGYSYYHQRNNSGLMRNVIIRNTNLNEWMVIVVFQNNDQELIEKLMSHIRDNFPEITSLLYVINPKLNDTIHDLDAQLYAGRDHIFEELHGLKFKIGPKSFFQTNSRQAGVLYETVLRMANLRGDETVYDLYTGTGTIANYVAKYCAGVMGIEYVEAAIEDARVNSTINGIGNARFYAGDMKDILNDQFLQENGRPDVIITDPPRAGMHPDVVSVMLQTAAEKIIYVSCNPATQARDIELLREKYTVAEVQPVDMFPHTHHVENIVCLTSKK